MPQHEKTEAGKLKTTNEYVPATNFTYRRYRRILLPVFIASVIAYLDRVNISYAALTMNTDLGFTASVYGTGAGIFFAGYILLEIPGALIAEKWRPSKWIARIMITWGVFSFMMAFVRQEWQFYLVRFLLGAAEASFYPVVYASVIPRWFTAEERPRALALMLTSLQISAIVGSPLAGWLVGISAAGFSGWQILFFVEALPALVFGIAVMFILPDNPADADWLDSNEKRYLLDNLRRETEIKKSIKEYTVIRALSDRKVLYLCLIYFLWITGYWGFNYWMPTTLKAVSGWSNMTIGLLVMVPMTASLAVMYFIGHSSSRTGEKKLHGAIPLFVGAIGMAVGTAVSDPGLSLFCVTLSAIGVFGPFGVWWSYPSSFLSGAAAAGAAGLINSAGNIGGYLGPYLVGFVKDFTGSYQDAYLYLAGSILAAGLLMLRLKK